MASTIQVGQYSLTVPAPTSLNSTQVTYSANGSNKTIALSNESLREQTTSLKKEISQTRRQLDAAETSINQAQTNLNQATAQLTQLVNQKPQYNRLISYNESRRLEAEYQKKLQLAQSAVNTAKQSLGQAQITREGYRGELNKQNTELAVLQDITGKFSSLQQASVNTQLELAQQQKKTQDSTIGATQQAADTLKNRTTTAQEAAPVTGPSSDNYSAADTLLTPEEQERLRAGAAAQLETFALRQTTKLTTTVELTQTNQIINANENTAGQDSETTLAANEKNAENPIGTKLLMPFKQPYDNPLHEYVNYTYNFSLFALSIDDYKSLTKNPKQFAFTAPAGESAKRLLIAGGGKRQDFGAVRNENFEEDFYFDDVRIETVIGLNARARGSNAVQISFKVIEPMGFTMFNRLLTMAEELGIRNYTETPFLLKIDFYGSSDIGQPLAPISNQTKFIAIKLLSCKTSIGMRGAEYQFQAVPYSHQAFTETRATTPANFSVTASTVGEFFSAEATAGVTQEQLNEQRAETEEAKTLAATGNIEEASRLQQNSAKKVYTVKSYAAGFNSFYAHLKDTGATKEINEVAFEFHETFINSRIVLPVKQKVENAPMSENASSAANPCADRAVTQASNSSISAGTDVLKVIEMVMQNSEVIREQAIDPKNEKNSVPEEQKKKKASPFTWFKVRATVDLIAFDGNTNKWSKKITYIVSPYTEPSVKHPNGPSAVSNGTVKEYNYIYTGKNKDVIDLKIDFDMTYYTAVNVARYRMEALGNKTVVDPANRSKEDIKLKPANNNPQPQQIEPMVINQQGLASGDAAKDSTGIIIADFVRNIYSTTRGDMINVSLRILGDPEFIKQDELYLNPRIAFSYDKQYVGIHSPGNDKQGVYSLNTDAGAVLVRLNFKTPTDIDEQTGLLRTDGKFQTGVFSGVYKVITVVSEFRQGKFEQTLELIRLMEQEEQLKGPGTKSIEQRQIDSTSSTTRPVDTPNPAALDDGSYNRKEFSRPVTVTEKTAIAESAINELSRETIQQIIAP